MLNDDELLEKRLHSSGTIIVASEILTLANSHTTGKLKEETIRTLRKSTSDAALQDTTGSVEKPIKMLTQSRGRLSHQRPYVARFLEGRPQTLQLMLFFQCSGEAFCRAICPCSAIQSKQ